MTERLRRPIVRMDPWSLIWRRRRHRQAATAQARRSLLACLVSTSRGEATEAITKSRIVVVTVAAQAWRSLSACLLLAKRGSNRGNRATSQGCSKVPLSLSRWQGGSGGVAGPVCCRSAWCRGQGQEGQSATGGNMGAKPARTLGRRLVRWFWHRCAGSS